MTEEKRQRVLLAVLAVCVLGAGGVWVALHDWGGSDSGRTAATAAQRKVREPTSTERAKRPSRRTRQEKVAERTKKVRNPDERDQKKKKTRGRKRGDTKTKKKKIVPVA